MAVAGLTVTGYFPPEPIRGVTGLMPIRPNSAIGNPIITARRMIPDTNEPEYRRGNHEIHEKQ